MISKLISTQLQDQLCNIGNPTELLLIKISNHDLAVQTFVYNSISSTTKSLHRPNPLCHLYVRFNFNHTYSRNHSNQDDVDIVFSSTQNWKICVSVLVKRNCDLKIVAFIFKSFPLSWFEVSIMNSCWRGNRREMCKNMHHFSKQLTRSHVCLAITENDLGLTVTTSCPSKVQYTSDAHSSWVEHWRNGIKAAALREVHKCVNWMEHWGMGRKATGHSAASAVWGCSLHCSAFWWCKCFCQFGAFTCVKAVPSDS